MRAAACLLVLCAPAALAQEAPPRNPDLNARVRGRVVSADSGAGLAGAVVQLRGVRRQGADLSSVWSESRTSGDDGTFDFPLIPAGDFTLNVNKPGYVGKSSVPVTVRAREERLRMFGQRFSLAEGQQQTIELEPAPALQ